MIISKALHNRLQKQRYSINCCLKSIRSINHPVLAEKGLPLDIFYFIFHEGLRKGYWVDWNGCVPRVKVFSALLFAVEIKLVRKKLNIPKSFMRLFMIPPDHGLEFLAIVLSLLYPRICGAGRSRIVG